MISLKSFILYISDISDFHQLYISKTARRREKWIEIWETGTRVIHIWCTFDLIVFKVILGSFGALVSKWLATRKLLVVERNGLKFVTRGRY